MSRLGLRSRLRLTGTGTWEELGLRNCGQANAPAACRFCGSYLLRYAARQRLAKLLQLPPRITRSPASCDPTGLDTGSAGYSPYQFWHHSQTFPAKSQIPSDVAPSG